MASQHGQNGDIQVTNVNGNALQRRLPCLTTVTGSITLSLLRRIGKYPSSALAGIRYQVAHFLHGWGSKRSKQYMKDIGER